jgi:hypothetical protein
MYNEQRGRLMPDWGASGLSAHAAPWLPPAPYRQQGLQPPPPESGCLPGAGDALHPLGPGLPPPGSHLPSSQLLELLGQPLATELLAMQQQHHQQQQQQQQQHQHHQQQAAAAAAAAVAAATAAAQQRIQQQHQQTSDAVLSLAALMGGGAGGGAGGLTQPHLQSADFSHLLSTQQLAAHAGAPVSSAARQLLLMQQQAQQAAQQPQQQAAQRQLAQAGPPSQQLLGGRRQRQHGAPDPLAHHKPRGEAVASTSGRLQAAASAVAAAASRASPGAAPARRAASRNLSSASLGGASAGGYSIFSEGGSDADALASPTKEASGAALSAAASLGADQLERLAEAEVAALLDSSVDLQVGAGARGRGPQGGEGGALA